MSSIASVFLFELEHGKFYAGASSDPVKAFEECREGLGPAWTRIHRPLHIREVVGVARVDSLDQHVRRWMLQYGVENVRGGSWSGVRLTDKDRQVLCGELTRQRGCVVS
jgi:predicted GIY-YIG superfamily endonuclease